MNRGGGGAGDRGRPASLRPHLRSAREAALVPRRV